MPQMKLKALSTTTVACLFATIAVADDFGDRLRDASDLCKNGDHEESVAAYIALADSQTDDARQFEALSAAAQCARLHIRSEVRALEICDRLEDEQWRLACRAVVYQWMTSPPRVLEDLGDVDMTQWPDALAATGFMVRGQAHYSENNADQAVDDFVRAYQFSTGRSKWAALQRLGNTFLNLKDDEILAEACFRHAMNNGGFAASGLQARVSLGNLLIQQNRFDDALKIFSVRPDGTWRTQMLIGTAQAQIAANNLQEAQKTLEELRSWPHVSGLQSKQIAEIANTLQEARN